MQKDYIFGFFSDINKILNALEQFISEDNILYVEKNLNDLESLTKKFRKKIKISFRELITAQKVKKDLESDEL